MPELPKGYAYIVKGTSTIHPIELDFSRRLNVTNNQVRAVISSPDLQINDTVSVYFTRGTTTIPVMIGGLVNNVTEVTSGKEKQYELEIWGKEYRAKYKTIYLPGTYGSATVILKSICDSIPLGAYFYNLSGKTVTVRRMSKPQYINEVIDQICRNHNIDYYYTPEGSIVFYTGTIGTMATQFAFPTEREYSEDLSGVYNVVRVHTNFKLLDDDPDKFTESTVGWNVREENYLRVSGPFWTGWKPEKISAGPPRVGNISVRAGPFITKWDYYRVVQGFRARINVKKEISPSLVLGTITGFGAQVGVKISSTYTGIISGGGMEVQFSPGTEKAEPRVWAYYSFGSIPTNSLVWFTIPVEIAFCQSKDVDNWTTLQVNAVWFDYEWHEIIESDHFIPFTIDLYFDNMYLTTTYSTIVTHTDSIAQYGVREKVAEEVGAEPLKPTRTSDLVARGSLVLRPYPEKVIRRLTFHGSIDPSIGYAYTLTFDDYTKVMTLTEVEHRFDGDDWYSILTFSSSPGHTSRSKFYKKLEYFDWASRVALNELGVLGGPSASGGLNFAPYLNVGEVVSAPGGNLGFLSVNEIGSIEKIEYIGEFSAGNINQIDYIGQINQIDYIGQIGNIGNIGNINYMNVNYIGQINHIENINYMNVQEIGQIDRIENINYMNVNEIGQINKIDNIGQFSANYIQQIGQIGNINNMQNVNYIGNIGSINNVNYMEVDTIGRINNLNNVGVANITTANITNISQIQNLNCFYLSVNNMATLNSATIGNLYAGYIGGITNLEVQNLLVNQVGSISTLNATIANILNIQNVNQISASRANISVISNVATLSASTANITKIQNVSELYATTAYITNISNVQNLSASNITNVTNIIATNAQISTISSVNNLLVSQASIGAITSTLNNLNAINAQISSITNVNNVVALNITVNNTLTVPGAATIYNVYGTSFNFSFGTVTNFLVGTITGRSINITAGTISNLFIGSASASVMSFSAGTIGNINITGGLRGGTFDFTSGHIDNLTVDNIATITVLNVTNVGTINRLNVTGVSTIATLTVSSQTIGVVTISSGTITGCTISAGTIGSLVVTTENVSTLNVTVRGSLSSAYISAGTIVGCTISAGTVGNLIVSTGNISTLTVSSGTISSCTISAATIGGVTISSATISHVSITSGNISSINISAGSITKLELSAPLIGRGVIRAENLIIEPVNIIPNPSFEIVDHTGSLASWGPNITRVSGGYNSSYAGVVTANAWAWAIATIPTQPGEIWRGGGFGKSAAGILGCRVFIRVLDSAFNPIGSLELAAGGGTGWTPLISYQKTIPTGGYYIVPGLFAYSYPGTFDAVWIVKDVGTTNLGAGIIETRHVKTNAITTNEIKFSGTDPPTIEGGKLWYDASRKLIKFAHSASDIALIPFYPIFFENAPPENLAPNQAFEIDRDGDGKPDFWGWYVSTGSGSGSLDTTYVRKGSKSFKQIASSYSKVEAMSSNIPTTGGKTYYASAWVYTPTACTLTDTPMCLGFFDKNLQNPSWYAFGGTILAAGWNFLFGTFTPASDKTYCRIYCRIDTTTRPVGATLYFDDIVLSEVRGCRQDTPWAYEMYNYDWFMTSISGGSYGYWFLSLPSRPYGRLVTVSFAVSLNDQSADNIADTDLFIWIMDTFIRNTACHKVTYWFERVPLPSSGVAPGHECVIVHVSGFLSANNSGLIRFEIRNHGSSTEYYNVRCYAYVEVEHYHR